MSNRAKWRLGAAGLSMALLLAAAVPAQAATRIQQNPPNWALDRIDQAKGLDQAYHYDTDAADVTVYVIDSGVDAKHPDLENRVQAGKDFLGGKDTADLNGHGTRLAGIIGGKAYGVAKAAQLFPVRVLDKDGGGATENIIAGIDWVTHNAHQPAVAVLGIGGVPNDKLDTAVRALAGVMPVAVPAGGETADAGGFSPGRVAEVLTVGATDVQDKVAPSSNFGAAVDLYAPGVEIPSLLMGGSGAGVLSGTSLAAAHVAGVAALYRSLHPRETPAQVTKALVDGASTGALTGVREGTANRLLCSACTPPPVPTPAP
ncbi:S8 family peptidase [Amycolatopsis sp. H20-H5]|uniref:S8 family peptidase n=1 Tax=Amycolatopsis sp. H20-H5 TaxID=3046309 RepID=UPI002DB8B112|nr:S8 family peptidase [Amycolatopsis sp. H20-H5]MEC3973738.1 S8 family peptidase [Amycolatopsis sp. H20-H5]